MNRACGRQSGFLAGVVLNIFGRKRKITPADLHRADFPTSTQRMGLRFTERLRDVFRGRWLRRT
jgi:hypothetical protein